MPFTVGADSTALGRPRTFLSVVLDESTSMEHVQDTTIQAFNHFIQRQREAQAEAKDEVFVTLTVFSYAKRIRTLYANKPLAEVPVLDRRAYSPDGDTALYDGIASSIAAMEREVGQHARVLMLVITDGEENASVRVKHIEDLKREIQAREMRGNWTFVFLSAGRDPYGAATRMGFKVGNVQPYTGATVGTALARVSNAVASYRKGEAMQTDTFAQGEAPKWDRPEWTRTGADETVEDVV